MKRWDSEVWKVLSFNFVLFLIATLIFSTYHSWYIIVLNIAFIHETHTIYCLFLFETHQVLHCWRRLRRTQPHHSPPKIRNPLIGNYSYRSFSQALLPTWMDHGGRRNVANPRNWAKHVGNFPFLNQSAERQSEISETLWEFCCLRKRSRAYLRRADTWNWSTVAILESIRIEGSARWS